MGLLKRLMGRSATPDVDGYRPERKRPLPPDSTSVAVAVDDDRGRLVAATSAFDDAGRYANSLALVGEALDAAPDDPHLLFVRASTLFNWGRFREALEAYLRLAATGFQHRDLFLQTGQSYYYAGHPQEAEAWVRKAVAAERDGALARFALAVVIGAQGRLEEAASGYKQVLEIQPDHFDALCMLGACRFDQGDAAGAEAIFRRAISLNAGSASLWSSLGGALSSLGQDHEAMEAFRCAAEIEAARENGAESFVNLATHLVDRGHIDDALAVLESKLDDEPNVEGHLAYGLALLTAGRLREGWDYHEFRWLRNPLLSLRPPFRTPVWDGQDLRGKTILLRGEQGFGDTIQFIRYASLVKALGGTVLAQVQPELEELATSCPGIDRVIKAGESLPAFDFFIHLLSLPRVFGTDSNSIPTEIPYLSIDTGRAARWSQRLGGGRLKVGLAWAGNPRHRNDASRSITLRALAPLADVEDVQWFSLQKGAAPSNVAEVQSVLRLDDLGPELVNFSDTAAAIGQLDLVICVDTGVAHLAGALGKPVWLLVAHASDYRWMEIREDSPWYSTLRLFRQKQRGDWDEVIQRVKIALRQQVDGNTITNVARGANSFGETTPIISSRSVPRRTARPVRPGFSAVAETRMGILQYLPAEPVVGDSIAWYGEYLQLQLDLLARLIRPGATVMEVGAGVGFHALSLATTIGSEGHLLLYERRGAIRQILRQNMAANRIGNVTLMRRALGAVGAPEMETLDELRLDRLALLKLSGGRAASEALDGGAETLWRLRPQLFIAAPDEAVLTELGIRVKEYGYRSWRVEKALFNPGNYNRRDDDIFVGRKALALLAIPEELEVDIALDECVELS